MVVDRPRDVLLLSVLVLRITCPALELGGASPRFSRTLSISPYSTASVADRKLSRSVSCLIFSTLWPVCLARILLSRSRDAQGLPDMDFHVTGLALHPAEGLVNHHPRMRQAVALAVRAGGQQHGAHARGLAGADGADIRLDELHGVINREPRRHHATGELMYR